MGGIKSFVNFARDYSKIWNITSRISLFGSQIKINFKEVLLVSVRVWKISALSMLYFLCLKQFHQENTLFHLTHK